ncbi:unnamed protein product [Pylaiella littoralis]
MAPMVKREVLAILALAATTASAGCPFLNGQNGDDKQMDRHFGQDRLLADARGSRSLTSEDTNDDGDSSPYGGAYDLSAETYDAVRSDIEALLTDSQEFWPADFGNYGPLFIRLAWHCAGSYRSSDGRGGCNGARIRFYPEYSWGDNTNLDKALDLLQPIKLKYGEAISWADLIILTGTVSITSMSGPSIGFCAGRLDDSDGFASLELGPTEEQEAVADCPVNGACESPLGTTTVGLIYVNPEGPMGVPDPAGSAAQIRDVFERMGMNDTETVALIGGGHAFGKLHGACPTGAGPNPMESPQDPWPGTCGDPGSVDFGRGDNTFTSGFEGAWTEEPTVWNNQYFIDLLEYGWETTQSPGNRTQWIPTLFANSTETEADIPNIVMLTSDIALLRDDKYYAIVQEFAASQEALDIAFSHAWYKLVTRDHGPVTRCVGPDVPPAQPFQLPLPVAPADLPSYDGAMEKIQEMITSDPSYASLFVTLAHQCAATYRVTDNVGGCNGARITVSPQSDWNVHQGLDMVVNLLDDVKTKYTDVSMADLIVLAGSVALGTGGPVPNLSFCGGRVDADADDPNNQLLSIIDPGLREYDTVILGVRDRMKIAGLTVPQMVALAGSPRNAELMKTRGYSGSYTSEVASPLSNEFFKILLVNTWEEVEGSGGGEYEAVDNPGVYALATDLALVWDPEFKAQTMKYAQNNDLFLTEFGHAWTTLMNADRFDGPSRNVCH